MGGEAWGRTEEVGLVGAAVERHRRLLGRVAVEIGGLGGGGGWGPARGARALLALAWLPQAAGLARAGHGWRELAEAAAAAERRCAAAGGGDGAAARRLRTRMQTLLALRGAAA